MNYSDLLNSPTSLLLFLVLLYLLYKYGSRNHSTWSKLGIAGPPPSLFLGNYRYYKQAKPMGSLPKWNQTYGRVYGIYLASDPVLVVSDLDILREVLVKDFNNFVNRFFQIKPGRTSPVNKGLFFLENSTWKRVRNLMTPTFSSSKLKNMCGYMDRCGTILSQCLQQKASKNEEINIKDLDKFKEPLGASDIRHSINVGSLDKFKEPLGASNIRHSINVGSLDKFKEPVFGAFTMDVITGTAFGLETNSQTEQKDPFVENCKRFFAHLSKKRILFNLAKACIPEQAIFPVLVKFVPVSLTKGREATFLVKCVSQMVEERKKDSGKVGNKRTDLLQLMVDAELDVTDGDPTETNSITTDHKRLSREEIVGQGFIVLIAGFETTASTLQFLSYNLAIHQEVQQRVYEEIVEKIGEAVPTYESVGTLKYLDCAIHETLRLFPPLPIVIREASKTTIIKGVTIPAGCSVAIPIYDITHDPEYFDDPETFRPERFDQENQKNLHSMLMELPFGYGPRQCIGMRLALLEIKFAMVHILRAVRLIKCENTPEKIFLKSTTLTVPSENIKLKAVIRSA